MLALFVTMHFASAQEGSISAVEENNNQYVIQSGDTLWELSQAFLGDPEYWPKLWSINEYITNPHWIYPGNAIGFTPGTTIDPPQINIITGEQNGYIVDAVEYESVEGTCGPDTEFNFTQPTGTFSVPGFIATEDDLSVLGTVEASPHNQSFMIEKNKIYMKLQDPELYSCGDVVTIFRQVKKKVRHPDSFFKKYGSMYRIVGDAKVIHQYGNYVVAEIRTSYSEIHRGDLVGASTPTIVQLEVGVPKGSLQGVIIDKLEQHHSFSSERDTVFIDRGTDDGVKVGDSFYIISQNDPYINDLKEDYSLPPSVIGRIVVVQVKNDHAVAVLTDLNTAIGGKHTSSGRKDLTTAGVSITQAPF